MLISPTQLLFWGIHMINHIGLDFVSGQERQPYVKEAERIDEAYQKALLKESDGLKVNGCQLSSDYILSVKKCISRIDGECVHIRSDIDDCLCID